MGFVAVASGISSWVLNYSYHNVMDVSAMSLKDDFEDFLAWISEEIVIMTAIWCSIAFVTIVGVYLYFAAHGDIAKRVVYEYWSYMFPCFAGYAAGLGVIRRKAERPLYALSLVFLFGGMGSFMASKGISFGFLVLLIASITLAAVTIITAVAEGDWKGRVFTKIFASVGAVVVVAALILTGSAMISSFIRIL